MDVIEPSHFDAVVLTSGLPEVLIGSALARAGKSVLLLDSTESYGASWATLSGSDFVHTLINRQLQRQQQQHSEQQQPQQQEPEGPQKQQQQLPGAVRIALQQLEQLHGVHGCSLFTHPQVEEALADKGLLIDLAPKVLYQDEALVQLLVACQAHNYLEFKLVEGSYIYLSGRLVRVPASRADLFADKQLPLAAKRSMGRFLAACMEAQQGGGRLKDAFGDGPLIDLLVAEGLDQQLQEVVLYGIAMAETLQQQQQQQQHEDQQAHAMAAIPATAAGTTTTSSSSSSSSASSNTLLTAAEGFAALQLYSSSLGRYGGSGAFMAPCYGCGSLPEAFVRLAAVKGAVTALRHGAAQVQLLPPPPQQQQQQQQPQQEQQQEEQQHEEQHKNDVAGNISSSRVQPPLVAEKEEAAVAAALANAEVSTVHNAAAATPPAAEAAAAEMATAAAAAAGARIVLCSGQQLTASSVVCCCEAAASAPDSSSSSSSSRIAAMAAAGCCSPQQVQVACAVALLDGSVVAGETSLLLVFPPGSLHIQQAAVVRGLQLGPAFGVAPPGKYLLYLTAVLQDGCNSSSSSSSSAEQVLKPAVQALASLHGLHAFQLDNNKTEEPEAGQDGLQAATTAVHGGGGEAAATELLSGTVEQAGYSSGVAADELQLQQHANEGQQQPQQQPPAALALPQVLAVCYHTTKQPSQHFQTQKHHQQQHQQAPVQEAQQHKEQDGVASFQTSNSSSASSDAAVLWCPAAAQGLVCYDDIIKATEAAYRQQFPDLPWLTDELPAAAKPAAAAAAGAGDAGEDNEGAAPGAAGGPAAGDAGGAGGVLDDGELDAIDELTAALLELSGPVEPNQ